MNQILRRALNLTMFYREPSEFVTGDKAPGHEGWKVELALDKLAPENYQTLCYTNSGENTNDQLETFYDSCSQGISGNVIVAQDYEIPYEAYLTKNGTSQEIYNKLTTPGERMNIGVRASNSLMNVQKTFKGTITVTSVTSAPNVGMKITGSIKHFSGGIQSEPIDAGVITPANVEAVVDNLTDTTCDVTYTIDWNDETSGTFELVESNIGTSIGTLAVTTVDTGATVAVAGLTPETDYIITFTGNQSDIQTVATFRTEATA